MWTDKDREKYKSLLQKSGRAWVLSPPSRFKRVAAFG